MSSSAIPTRTLTLTILPQRLCIARLAPDAALPTWALQGPFHSLTRTPDELSVVCSETDAPEDIPRTDGWRALMVQGPLDFSLVGIVADLATALAAARISIFVVSTYETDFVLVREGDLRRAAGALRDAGHGVV